MNKSIDIKMKAKGYKHGVQFETVDGPFGEMLYFKTAEEVGPFMRETFKDSDNAKIKLVRNL